MSKANAKQFLAENHDRFITEMKEFIAIPSVSADSAYKADILKAAQWSADKMKAIGLTNVQIIETKMHPFVYGENLSAGPDKPTVLLYGHYDVQPPDPFDLWKTEPFEATIKDDGYVYGRGTSDMKGQILATFNAIEAVVKSGDLPVNLKFMLEGEEESGGPSMEQFLEDYKEMLACDICLNPDAGMASPTQPSINYALRGIAAFEITVYGPNADVHSGGYGNVIQNPANELARVIGKMIDDEGRVQLPGFYDDVLEMSAEERAELNRLSDGTEDYLAQTGVPKLFGEKGYTPIERAGGRPTLDVNGMISGYTGEGGKTIIPAKASAKITTRLVPNQTPEKTAEQMRAFLEATIRDTVRWELEYTGGATASISDRKSKYVQALSDGLEEEWNTKPIFERSGGSIPVVGEMQKKLGVESVLTGFGLPGDSIHSPNERLHLETWTKGMRALVNTIYNLGA